MPEVWSLQEDCFLKNTDLNNKLNEQAKQKYRLSEKKSAPSSSFCISIIKKLK